MPANATMLNPANARIFGGDDDAVWLGPVGTRLPEGLEDPVGLEHVGWLGPDGISVTPDISVGKFPGHQGGRTVRTKVTNSSTSVQFQCLESTATTMGLQMNILEKATKAGVVRARVSSGFRVEPRAAVIDLFDVDAVTIQERYCCERIEIGERSEWKAANGEIRGYTFTAEIIGDYWVVTNNPAFDDTPGAVAGEPGSVEPDEVDEPDEEDLP